MKEYTILSRSIDHAGGQWTSDLDGEMNAMAQNRWRMEGLALSDGVVVVVMARETVQPLSPGTKKAVSGVGASGPVDKSWPGF